MDKQSKRFLCVDYGNKRIGLAVSDALGMLAFELATYAATRMRNDVSAISQIAKNQQAVKIIVGLPLNMDGTDSLQTQKVRAFANALQNESGLEVILVDERLTTVEADNYLEAANIKKQKRFKIIDQVAARIILQSYLDANKN